MKLYYICDTEFHDMRNNFINSLKDKDNFTIVDISIDTPRFDTECPEHLKNGGGIDIWKLRLSYIIDIIKKSDPNEYFIFSDVDIVFYKPLLPALNKIIKDQDVLFLREFYDDQDKQRTQEYYDANEIPYKTQDGNINFGFNVIKACEQTHKFFSDILESVKETGVWEQALINTVLYSQHNYDLQWELLPPEFFSTSVGLHHIHKEIKEVVLYHANCAIKKETKYSYMHHINNVINQRL